MHHLRCVLSLKFISLHHANIIVETRADIGVTKLRPMESDISLICLDAPLGDCFVLWHAGDIAKLSCRSVQGFLSTDSLNFLFSLGVDCRHYNSVSTTIQTVMDKVQFLYPKFNTSRASMAL